ncbi:MAG: iron-siderophore ABC transporter substrate-binding protein [Blastochloris sp.]|nr:iron-siderophore ABC transporter substrate-binding protein [Blastochloris sp.]
MKLSRLLPIVVGLLLFVAPATAQDEACDTGFRQIEHALGELCVPENPQRVVALDLTVFELMLITDVQPAVKSNILIQSFYERAHPELLDEIEALTADLPDVGFPPNFEVIAEAQPDLIIGVDNFMTESVHGQLSQIAPTVVLSVEPGDWRERLVQAGEALNVGDEVGALLADYAAREDEFRELVPDADDIELSLVRTFPGQVGVMLTGSIADRVVADVGLSRPEAQVRDLDFVLDQLGGRAELTLSREELTTADGDVVFVFGSAEALFADPLWNALDAVGRGDVYEVGYYWYVEGLISAHDMLDDLFAHIAGDDSTLPNPFEDGITPTD